MHYICSLESVVPSKERRMQKNSDLSPVEKSEFRTLIGQLSWVATNSRPDIAYDVCELSTLLNEANVGDFMRLNKVISRVKNETVILQYPSLQNIDNCMFECFSDASFANLSNSGSQGGFIIFLKDENNARCPIFWKLGRYVESSSLQLQLKL